MANPVIRGLDVVIEAGRKWANGSEVGLPVEGTDPRLSDPREPTDHADTHANGGSDEIITPLDPRAYPVTVGTTGGRPATPADPQLYWSTDDHILSRYDGSDWVDIAVIDYADLVGIPSTFAPSAHATAHANAGADEITTALDVRAYPLPKGDIASRPAGALANAGTCYYAEDEFILYRDGGGVWDPILRGWEFATQSADATESATTLTNTDLVFNLMANSTYLIDLYIFFQSAATTTGIALAWDTSQTVGLAAVTYAHITTLAGGGALGDAIADATKRGITGSVNAANTDYQMLAQGLIRTSTNACTARLQFASEVNTSQVTFRRYSTGRCQKANAT